MKKILIAEDDKTIRETIKDFLSDGHYYVETAEDGAEALQSTKKNQPDLIILDLGLPKITGEAVLKEVKKLYPDIPVIILTARNQSIDVVRGFNLGADDYIAKPFELEELLARVRVKLKDKQDKKLQADDLILDPKSIVVTRNGIQIFLTPHEFKLLHYLLVNKGKVLTREMILNRVWQYSLDVDSRVVDVYVGYLRKKIDSNSSKKLISSIRGFGYVIKD
ncbi:MAG: response regulator transcription factor [Candidatus Levybacteria bacterium]|nr:response regulator transcription factor [Candidatus Levybacteria bacterium]